jgi:HNH endonuclease
MSPKGVYQRIPKRPEAIDEPRLIPLLRDDPSPRVVGFALVDASDFESLEPFRWGIHVAGYACRGEARDGRPHTVFMHRTILGLSDGDNRKADHINRNRLDNRRANLRVLTDAENSQNQTARIGRTSMHRGVSWDSTRQRWIAYITVDGRRKYIGRFRHEADAAAAAQNFRRAFMPFSDEGMSAQ